MVYFFMVQKRAAEKFICCVFGNFSFLKIFLGILETIIALQIEKYIRRDKKMVWFIANGKGVTHFKTCTISSSSIVKAS